MKLTSIAVCVLFASLAPVLHAAESSSANEHLRVVKSYLDARAATMQAAANAADVERALEMLTPAVVYEHPRAGMTRTGIDTLRAGMKDFLGASRNASITITGSLQGRDMIAVQTAVSFEARDGDGWTPVSRSQVWVFEFDGAKIKRIIEYW